MLNRSAFTLSRMTPVLAGIAAAAAIPDLDAQAREENDAPVAALIGEWASGGMTAARTLLSLYPDGTYAKRIVVTTELAWTVEGDVLRVAPVYRKGRDMTFGRAVAMLVAMSGDTLVASAGADSLRLVRMTPAVEGAPFVGRWKGTTDLNEELIEDFTGDGRVLASVTLAMEAGRYWIEGNSITWYEQLPGNGQKKSRYRIVGDRLRIGTPPEPSTELVRHVVAQ